MKLSKFLFTSIIIFSCFGVVYSQNPFFDRNSDDIVAISWSHSGDFLVVGYYDGQVKLFSSDGELLRLIKVYPSPVTAMAWSPNDSQFILSAGRGGSEVVAVELWNTADWVSQPIGYNSPDIIISFVWNPDNNYVFAGTGNANSSDGKTLWVWDSNGQFITNLAKSSIHNLSISPDNQKIAISDWDNIQILNTTNYQEIIRLQSNSNFIISPVTSFLWTADSSKLISGYYNGKIHVWDINSLSTTPIFELFATNNPRPDLYLLEYMIRDLYIQNNQLYAISGNGEIRVWDLITGQLINQQVLEIDERILSANFNTTTNEVAYDGIGTTGVQITDVCTLSLTNSLETDLISIINQALSFSQATICLTENAPYTLTVTLPNITGEITIIGNGASITMTGGAQIFNVAQNGSLTLKNVTISGGNATEGGAIYNAGDLILENVILENNSAVRGGAIYNTGNLMMNGGAIQNNSASEFGGGIYNAGEMNLDGVNIRENDAPEGSGVYQGG